MRKPRRIQRRRTKGWQMPSNAVYVGRPGMWGNPFIVGRTVNYAGFENTYVRDRAHAVELYQTLVSISPPEFFTEVRDAMRGKDLACWCPLDQPCHADVLLAVANQESS